MNIGIIIQARMGSSRLPGKVLKEILGKPLLWYLVQRLRSCLSVSKIVIATSTSQDDDLIEDFCKINEIDCFRGSENDVLGRYYQCALKYKIENIVRITGDCPLVDPGIVDGVINFYKENLGFDLVKTGPFYPEGFDTEVFSFKNLETVLNNAKLKSDREHVTAFLWKHDKRFRIKILSLDKDYSFLRLTVDEVVDFEVVRDVVEYLYPRKGALFNFKDILLLYKENRSIFKKNENVIRNEGYLKSLEKD